MLTQARCGHAHQAVSAAVITVLPGSHRLHVTWIVNGRHGLVRGGPYEAGDGRVGGFVVRAQGRRPPDDKRGGLAVRTAVIGIPARFTCAVVRFSPASQAYRVRAAGCQGLASFHAIS